MFLIKNLTPTQDAFRDYEQVTLMSKFVVNGGFFTREALLEHDPTRKPLLIAVTKFEDGALYIRDGLHRVAAMCMASRSYLREDEYCIEPMNYVDYDTVNFKVGWVTPHDPRKFVRKADLTQFKALVAVNESEEFIRSNYCVYLMHRELCHRDVASLIDFHRQKCIWSCLQNLVLVYKQETNLAG